MFVFSKRYIYCLIRETQETGVCTISMRNVSCLADAFLALNFFYPVHGR